MEHCSLCSHYFQIKTFLVIFNFKVGTLIPPTDLQKRELEPELKTWTLLASLALCFKMRLLCLFLHTVLFKEKVRFFCSILKNGPVSVKTLLNGTRLFRATLRGFPFITSLFWLLSTCATRNMCAKGSIKLNGSLENGSLGL